MTGRLEQLLIKHEGFKTHCYEDINGLVHIGVGRNLDDIGLSEDEVMYLLYSDIRRCDQELLRAFPWYLDLTRVRKDFMICMCFNLGLTRLLKFKLALGHMAEQSYDLAAMEFLDSKWSKQVGQRSIDLTNMLKSSRYPSA